MDIYYFLNRRLVFIRQFYATTSAPYIARKEKIKAKEEPFIPPPSESAEPPFLEEWIESDDSLHVIAHSCVSMLSAALHLYFETWVTQSCVPVDGKLKKSFKEAGWFLGYKTHFYRYFAIDFDAFSGNLCVFHGNWTLSPRQTGQSERSDAGFVFYS